MLQLFELYRYPKPSPGADVEYIDGLRNIFNATRWPAWPGLGKAGRAQLDSGIGCLQSVQAFGAQRRPAIMIASKPHRAGSDWTPWHDELNPYAGHVRYYGDRKATHLDPPELIKGNQAVLKEFALHQSNSRADRMMAGPLLFFEGLVHEGAEKGFWRFIGVGLLERAELVTQVDRNGRVFTNYAFDCLLVDLGPENLNLSWNWIAARRDPTKTPEEALALAPSSWRKWVDKGMTAMDGIRQSVARNRVLDASEQRPIVGTPAAAALDAVISHYKSTGGWSGVGEHRFEGMASEIVGTLLSENGQYQRGWITKRGGDGGIDFVGRLDLGSASSSLKLGVLGQAKCRGMSAETPGVDLARTVSRLDRGWVGAFVTTSYFTTAAQREASDDRFPLLLVNGRQVGETVVLNAAKQGVTVAEYIELVDTEYDGLVSSRQPTEILSEGLQLG